MTFFVIQAGVKPRIDLDHWSHMDCSTALGKTDMTQNYFSYLTKDAKCVLRYLLSITYESETIL